MKNKFIIETDCFRIIENDRRTSSPFIRSRIFPQTDPYCHASFLIEIQIPQEYPCEPPEIHILDPIYHPFVRENGTRIWCRN